jgi:hypothetical protein
MLVKRVGRFEFLVKGGADFRYPFCITTLDKQNGQLVELELQNAQKFPDLNIDDVRDLNYGLEWLRRTYESLK